MEDGRSPGINSVERGGVLAWLEVLNLLSAEIQGTGLQVRK